MSKALILDGSAHQGGCAHEWRVTKNASGVVSTIDHLGRPYCAKCFAMPRWFNLDEIDTDSRAYEFAMRPYGDVGSGRSIIVERDE